MVMVSYILFVTLRIKDKHGLHWSFIGTLLSLWIWNIGMIIAYHFLPHLQTLFVIEFIGTCLVPPFFLLFGYSYAHSEKALSLKVIPLFIVPLFSMMMAGTNHWHHLLFKHFSINIHEIVYGHYFYVHTFYSYACVFAALFYLVNFSIKNSGIFSKQVFLVIVGSAVPILINLITTLNWIEANLFYYPVSFTFALLAFWLAIIRYDFLNIIPIALKIVVNAISDGFVVVNADMLIIDFNQTLVRLLHPMVTFRRKEPLVQVLNPLLTRDTIMASIQNAFSTNQTLRIEQHWTQSMIDKYFIIEFTPIIYNRRLMGTVILFKDITELKQSIVLLEEKNTVLDEINFELQTQNEEVAILNKQLRELAEIDALTGAYNRRFFNEYYEIEVTRALNQVHHYPKQQGEMDFGIALIDIDNFKSINDKYGHLVGDSVLKKLVETMKSVLFSRDIVCRYGGEEFAVIFTRTNKTGAIKAAEKIRKEIEQTHFFFDETMPEGRLTVSIGFASFEKDFSSKENNIIKVADQRLYRAKQTGKNKVVFD